MSSGQLVVLDRSGHDVKRYELQSGLVTLGSHPACDIRVILPTVQSHHATITVHSNQTLVRDLSDGYTLVNGAPVSVHALEHQDIITLGDRSLRWEYMHPAKVKPQAQQPAVNVRGRKSQTRGRSRTSEEQSRCLDPALHLMLEMKHRASIPGGTKQVAIVQPQRRVAVNDANENKARLVTKPHRPYASATKHLPRPSRSDRSLHNISSSTKSTRRSTQKKSISNQRQSKSNTSRNDTPAIKRKSRGRPSKQSLVNLIDTETKASQWIASRKSNEQILTTPKNVKFVHVATPRPLTPYVEKSPSRMMASTSPRRKLLEKRVISSENYVVSKDMSVKTPKRSPKGTDLNTSKTSSTKQKYVSRKAITNKNSKSSTPIKATRGTSNQVKILKVASPIKSPKVATPKKAKITTPLKSPKLATPIKTKLASPVKSPKLATPIKTKLASPLKSPKLATPIKTKLASPMKSPKLATPIKTKLASPLKSPKVATPIKTKLASPLKSPKVATPNKSSRVASTIKSPKVATTKETKVRTPTFNEALNTTPHNSPRIIPQRTPIGTPQKSPRGTPQKSPRGTPQKSPRGTPQKSPRGTPQKSPRVTLQKSPRGTPQKSPRGTPQKSPRGTPQRSSRGTPLKTVRDSIQETPQDLLEHRPTRTTTAQATTPQNAPRTLRQKTPRGTPYKTPSATPRSVRKKTPAKSTGKSKVIKIQAPLVIDENKKAALMILTRTPRSKLLTPKVVPKSASLVVKKPSPVVKLPIAYSKSMRSSLLSPNESMLNGSRYSSATNSSRSSKRTSASRSVSIFEITDSEDPPPKVRRTEEALDRVTSLLTSPRKSALKNPDSTKKSKKSESIKFDLSNLAYNDSSDVELINNTSIGKSNDSYYTEDDISLRYSDISQATSPSPRKSIHSRISKTEDNAITPYSSPRESLSASSSKKSSSPKSLRISNILQNASETSQKNASTTRKSRSTSGSSRVMESYSIVDLVSMEDSADKTMCEYSLANSHNNLSVLSSATLSGKLASSLTEKSPTLITTSTPFIKRSSKSSLRKSQDNVTLPTQTRSRSTPSKSINLSQIKTPGRRSKSLSTPIQEDKSISVLSSMRQSRSRGRGDNNDDSQIYSTNKLGQSDTYHKISSNKSPKRTNLSARDRSLNISDSDMSMNSALSLKSSKKVTPVSKRSAAKNKKSPNDGQVTPENAIGNEEAATPILNVSNLLKRRKTNSFIKINRKKSPRSFNSEPRRPGRKSVVLNLSFAKKVLLKRRSYGSGESDKTDENAPITSNEDKVTPKSTVKIVPETVKHQHSTAKKPKSKRSIIDNLEDSDIIKHLFNSPVKRKLSQSMSEFSRNQLSDDEISLPKRQSHRTMSVTRHTPDQSLAIDNIQTPQVPTEVFVSPLTTPTNSPNLAGLKKLFQKNTPRNDLTDLKGVKTLLGTPRTRKSPKNDLTNISGVKNLLRKGKTPRNDLTDVRGVKEVFELRSPRNDLRRISGVKSLFQSEKKTNSPKNVRSSTKHKTPKIDQNIRSVKKVINQKSPKNDLLDVRGVKQIFRQHRSANILDDLSGVEELFNETGNESFNKKNNRKSMLSKSFLNNSQQANSTKKAIKLTSINKSKNISFKTNVSRELLRLATDTVEGSTLIERSRSRLNITVENNHGSKKSFNIDDKSLPIKKRSLLGIINKSSESSGKKRVLAIKELVLAHSTPVKGKRGNISVAADLGRVSPITVTDNKQAVVQTDLRLSSPKTKNKSWTKLNTTRGKSSITSRQAGAETPKHMSQQNQRSSGRSLSSQQLPSNVTPVSTKARGKSNSHENSTIKHTSSTIVIPKKTPKISPRKSGVVANKTTPVRVATPKTASLKPKSSKGKTSIKRSTKGHQPDIDITQSVLTPKSKQSPKTITPKSGNGKQTAKTATKEHDIYVKITTTPKSISPLMNKKTPAKGVKGRHTKVATPNSFKISPKKITRSGRANTKKSPVKASITKQALVSERRPRKRAVTENASQVEIIVTKNITPVKKLRSQRKVKTPDSKVTTKKSIPTKKVTPHKATPVKVLSRTRAQGAQIHAEVNEVPVTTKSTRTRGKPAKALTPKQTRSKNKKTNFAPSIVIAKPSLKVNKAVSGKKGGNTNSSKKVQELSVTKSEEKIPQSRKRKIDQISEPIKTPKPRRGRPVSDVNISVQKPTKQSKRNTGKNTTKTPVKSLRNNKSAELNKTNLKSEETTGKRRGRKENIVETSEPVLTKRARRNANTEVENIVGKRGRNQSVASPKAVAKKPKVEEKPTRGVKRKAESIVESATVKETAKRRPQGRNAKTAKSPSPVKSTRGRAARTSSKNPTPTEVTSTRSSRRKK